MQEIKEYNIYTYIANVDLKIVADLQQSNSIKEKRIYKTAIQFSKETFPIIPDRAVEIGSNNKYIPKIIVLGFKFLSLFLLIVFS